MAFRKISKGGGLSNWTLFFILIAVVVLGGIITVVISRTKMFEKFTNPGTTTIEFYSMTGCGHCDDFNEKIWQPLKKELDTTKYNLVEYNISESGAERGKKFNVTSTPTILAVKDDTIKATFEGERTLEKVKKFIVDNSVELKSS